VLNSAHLYIIKSNWFSRN